MDNYTDVLEVLDVGGESNVVHLTSVEPTVLGEEDCHLLRLDSFDKLEEILHQYRMLDIPRDALALFRYQLTEAKDAWFVEVGDSGLVYLTDIIPTFSANFKVVFWDKRIGKARRELMQRILVTAVREFELTRVQAFAPVTNAPLAEHVLSKVGFVKEGVLRKAWREEGEDVDVVVFSILREETFEWLAMPTLMTSSA